MKFKKLIFFNLKLINSSITRPKTAVNLSFAKEIINPIRTRSAKVTPINLNNRNESPIFKLNEKANIKQNSLYCSSSSDFSKISNINNDETVLICKEQAKYLTTKSLICLLLLLLLFSFESLSLILV